MQTAGYNLYRARRRTEERQRPTPPAHKTSGPTTARRNPDTQSHAFAKQRLAKTKLALTNRRREGRVAPQFRYKAPLAKLGASNHKPGGLGGAALIGTDLLFSAFFDLTY